MSSLRDWQKYAANAKLQANQIQILLKTSTSQPRRMQRRLEKRWSNGESILRNLVFHSVGAITMPSGKERLREYQPNAFMV